MATRRMFSKEIISSDAFMTMGLGSQALYYTLGMNADDDGVVNNPKIIQRSIGANDDDMRVLIAKRFIIPIEDSGIVVIKHWRINNYIQKDRYTKSKYLKDLGMLGLDENGAYTSMDTKCIQNGYTMDTQDSIDKVSIDKNRVVEVSINNINKEKEEEKELTLQNVELFLKERNSGMLPKFVYECLIHDRNKYENWQKYAKNIFRL